MKLFLLAVISTFLIGISTVQSAQGLNYKYYLGTWSLLPDFNSLTPTKSGTATTVNIDPRTREVQYAFLYQGYITIPATGNYTFETLSDDGSKLYIGTYDYNTPALVNNDGVHGNQVKTGTISLNAGVYPIAFTYFQNNGNQNWEIYWSSTSGISRQKLPDNVLSTSEASSSNPTGTAGINFKYYEGNWNLLPDFSQLTPVVTGTASNANLSARKNEKQYAFLWQGFITIPSNGNYTFETLSDDGSKLYIGNYNYQSTALVNNDGLHGNQLRSGTIALTAGVYPITMSFFQNGGNQTWEAYWSSNTGISRQIIPDNVLSTNGSSNVTPPNSSNGISYNYYEGNWSNLPDFSTLSPVKSGITANIDISPRNRETNYAFVWQGNINVPASGTYTFETNSDDGSKVYIGSSTIALVNNDGLHGNQIKTGSLNLNAGLNPITVTYFQQGAGQVMELYWSSTSGLSRQKVPDNAFTPTTITPPAVETPTPTPTPVPIPLPPTNTSGSDGLKGVNNYYFSTTYGDDSRSSAQARNSSTPWKSLNKLNSVMSSLQAGDAVLFNRGDVFDGSINVSVSGGTNVPIIFSAYGNGNKPVINGLYTLSNWSNIGNGVWQTNCPSPDKVNMVTMNGVAQAMGRYPNITEPNRGYLTLDAHAGTYLITDYQLSGSTNFTGAEVVIRKNNWVLDRCTITNHSGNNIYYSSPTGHEPADGYGYFIQNSAQTLDQLGEWYYDQNYKVLKMYFGSNNPNSYDVKASTVNTVALVSNKSNIIMDNISFVGGDDYGIRVEYSQNVRVQYCNVNLSGTEAVSGQNLNNLSLEGNYITNTSNDAIDCNACSNTAVRNNVIKNTGLMLGMGQSGNQQYNGILVEGSSNSIEFNTVENTGYCGITFAGESLSIKNNYVNNFCLTVEDGGGIYGWGDLNKYNRKISGNIVLNGIGAFEGTNYQFSTGATGIFHDDESANIEMTDNTIANCSRSGIFIHNSHEMTLRNNTMFNNRTQLSMVHDPISINHPIRNITLDNNILFSKQTNQFLMEMSSTTNDMAYFGNYTNNYYDRPIDDNGVIYTTYKNNSGSYQYSFYDVAGWKSAFSSYDQQSKASPMKIPAYKVNSYNGGNRFGNASFNSNTGNIFCLSSPGKCAVSWNSGGKLDGGALQITFDGSSGATNTVGNFIDIGSTSSGRAYQIKFSLIGYNAGKTIKAFILDGSTYAHLSETRYFDLTTSRTENDFLYIAPSSANTTLLAFEIAGPDCPYWLDNLQVYDVNTTITNPDDYIRFVYNPTSSATSVSLNGNYVDARNNYYSGSINLAPFTSAVLINQSANQITDATATERQENVVTSQLVQEEALNSRILSANVSPNPTTDNVQITLNAPQGSQKSSLSITSISGAVMKIIPVTSSSQRLTVDVSTWSKGVYIINYNCDGHIIYKKFVKQ
jgi:hypothetical protein